MGLDVYLHRQDADPVAIEKLESASAAYSEEQYSLMARGRKYDEIPEADLQAWRDKRKQYNKEHGLDEDGVAPGRETVDEPSSLYPEHLFRVGYFRSSYNEGGVNSVLRNLDIPDLYDIFPHEDEHEFTPDWQAAKVTCQDSIEQLKAYIGSDSGKYRTIKILEMRFNDQTYPSTEREAIEIFLKKRDENAKHNEDLKRKYFDFSCREGEFFLRGLKVYAVLPGKTSGYGEVSYMIVENDANDPDEGLNWYVQALEVVLETIEYVLKTGEPERYRLSWSS